MSVNGGEVSLRCPACGAALHPDASWCSLCFHDLRSATAPSSGASGADALDPLTAPLIDVLLPATPRPAVPPVAPPAPAAPSAPAASPLEGPLPASGTAKPAATWPCLQCGTANPLQASTCAGCASPFLALTEKRKPFVLPLVGDVHLLSRAQRMGLAVGVVLAVLVPLAVLTFLLTPEPPTVVTPPGTEVVQISP